jgi:6-pyruvoyl-tetrahydropterin synthase
MQRKHKNCRWKSEKIRSRNFYILIEGYYWLINVYFNSNMKLIEADIKFFKELIKQYEEVLKLESKNLFDKDIEMQELVKFFNKKYETIEKAIWKMIKVHSNYRYVVNNEYVITKEGVEWLCKNCFKQKYLEVLESYKMNLTEEFIRAGYIYDNFFHKN